MWNDILNLRGDENGLYRSFKICSNIYGDNYRKMWWSILRLGKKFLGGFC